MKILFTQETDWLKRNPAQQHHLAEMLSLRGHEIRVIDYELSWRTQGERELRSKRKIFEGLSKIHEGAEITVIRPGIIKIPWLDYASLVFSHKKEIERQIEKFAPDVIIGFGILNSYLSVRASRKSNIPFIYYWIDVLHRLIPFKPFQIVGKLVGSRTLKQSDTVLVINDKLREQVIRLGAPEKKTLVLRAGIDSKRFALGSSDDKVVRNQYRIKSDDFVLFFMGWLYNFSGLKEVALQLRRVENHNIKLLIIGKGDAYGELQEIRQKYNLQDRVILTGEKAYSEIPNLIATADICLLPAYPWEPVMQDIVPIKMYEYMAMGKPVIATKLPGVMKEFGESNGVVYIEKPEDVITKALELVQSGRVKELGLKARKFAEKNSWDNITDQFEKILEGVIREKQYGAIS